MFLQSLPAKNSSMPVLVNNLRLSLLIKTKPFTDRKLILTSFPGPGSPLPAATDHLSPLLLFLINDVELWPIYGQTQLWTPVLRSPSTTGRRHGMAEKRLSKGMLTRETGTSSWRQRRRGGWRRCGERRRRLWASRQLEVVRGYSHQEAKDWWGYPESSNCDPGTSCPRLSMWSPSSREADSPAQRHPQWHELFIAPPKPQKGICSKGWEKSPNVRGPARPLLKENLCSYLNLILVMTSDQTREDSLSCLWLYSWWLCSL